MLCVENGPSPTPSPSFTLSLSLAGAPWERVSLQALCSGTAPAAAWLWNIIWNSHAFKVDTAGAISQRSRAALTAVGERWLSPPLRKRLAEQPPWWKRNGSALMCVCVCARVSERECSDCYRLATQLRNL